MIKMKIRSKAAFMITLWMLLLSMLGLYSIKMSSISLEKSYGQNMVSITNVMHGTMATILANKIETLQNIETRPVIITPLKNSNRQFSEIPDRDTFISKNDRIWKEFIAHSETIPNSATKQMPPLIKEVIENETVSILKDMFFVFYEKNQGRTVFSKLSLTNAFGVNIAATNLTDDYYEGDEEWWQNAFKNGVYLSEIHYDKIADKVGSNSDDYGLTIAVRINDQDKNLIGVVKAVVSSRWIMREVQAVTDRNEYTDIKLVTQDGNLIYSNKPFTFFEDVSEHSFFKKSLVKEGKDSTGHNEHSTRQKGYFLIKEGGIEKLYAHSNAHAHTHAKGSHILPMENVTWCIFIGNHVNRVLAPMFTLQKRMVVVYGLVMLLALTIGLFVIRRYTRLIIDLRNAAFAVAGGDFTRSVKVTLKDELGDLTHSFNVMTSRLRTTYKSLEDEIDIRKKAEQTVESALKEAEFAGQKAEYSRQEAEDARQKAESARKEAESANRAKSDFIANMSHELRTPLNAIIGFSQLMEREKDATENQRETVHIIMRSGMHLLNLINDILAMSKIEAGKVEIQHEDFDFFQMIQDITSMVKSRIQVAGLELVTDIDPAIPRYIKSDEQKLRQILVNLLINAVKFTKQGSVSLRIKCQGCHIIEAMPRKEAILFEVEDTGIGISQEDIKRLFQKFMRTRTGMNASEGTGLGLSISQEYVRLMGGEITVESEVDKGSLFRFSIDVDIADMISGEIKKSECLKVVTLEPGQIAYRILIVEDNPENQMLLSRLLLSVGFDVRIAANGLEGVEIFESWQPHLIWMDMRMPVMDGYESCRRIRQIEQERMAEHNSAEHISIDEKPERVVIIALTASAFEEQKNLVLASGCDDFIRKPFLESDIFDAITRHIGVKYIYESLNQSQSSELDESLNHDGRVDAATPLLSNKLMLSSSGKFMQSPSDNFAAEILPKKIISDMKQALIDLDLDKIEKLTNEISVNYPHKARRISTLASNFKYKEIMEVLDKNNE